jgi:dipeptidyl aminopeptidase/acylaminoacyl peptidase
MAFDPITQDVPYDPDYPASSSGLVFYSAGAKLNGVIYHPAGEGLHPLALLLHGFPGHERNLDLAQILRRAGWHTAVFHYRGSWGSAGSYRFAHVLEDVQAALDYFRQPQIAEQMRVDTSRMVAIGSSMGGWAALIAAARGLVDEAATLAAANMGLWGHLFAADPHAMQTALGIFEQELDPLHGVSAVDLVTELSQHYQEWNLLSHVHALAQRRLLLVAGKRDDTTPPFDHHVPLVRALETAGAARLQHHLISGDHGFSDSRLALARLVLDWLA